RDLLSGNVSLLLTPSDTFEALLRFDFYDDENEGPENLNMSNQYDGLCAGFGIPFGLGCDSTSHTVAAADDFKTSVVTLPHLNHIDGNNASLEMNWDMGNSQVTVITGYQDFEELLDTGFEGAPILVTQFRRPQEYEQFSQELRLSSQAFDSKLDYVLGLFYFSSEYTTIQDFNFFGAKAQYFTSNQEIDALAVFGEGTFAVSDALSLTFGARYTDEEKTFNHDHPIEGTGPFTFQGKDSWSEFTHRIGFQYDFSDDLMAYITWSTGFRSGGWNGRPGTLGGVGPYDPETVDNYEVGFRSELLDGRMTFNVTGFITEYDDKQEFNVVANPVTGGFDTKVENAAEVSYEGAEVEIFAKPLPEHDFSLRFSLGILDAKFDKRMRGGVNVADQTAMIYAPDLTASMGFTYNRAIFNGSTLNLSGNLNHVGKHRGRTEIPMEPIASGRDVVKSRNELDLAATVETPFGDGGKFFVSLYGTDLLKDGAYVDRPVEVRPLFFIGGMRVRRQYGVRIGIEY
ncbi:MAG: TonB-dependent receptor, partial [Halieaceae bacterium]|nr:TonB-dependent receptor [Halieaceae bacterium]